MDTPGLSLDASPREYTLADPFPESAIPTTFVPDPASPASQPKLAPLPTPAGLNVPAHTQFRYEGLTPLKPDELQAITAYHALYMQGAGIGSNVMLFRKAKADALATTPTMPCVLDLMKRQYTLACVGTPGAAGAEALTIKDNIAWVEALLQMEG